MYELLKSGELSLCSVAQMKQISGKAGFDDVNTLKKAMKEYVERNSPVEKQKRRVQRAEKKIQKESAKKLVTDQCVPKKSQPLPAKVRDHVFIRDGGQCTFAAADGTRCDCTIGLEVDHLYPRALGGDNSLENLRLLCFQHNQLAAEQVFGRAKIESMRAKS